jgi:hypothetical protein
MADRYAPSLFLEVLAFWFILRWLLSGRVIAFIGRALVVLMVIGVFSSLGMHRHVWAAFFAGSALLSWVLLHRCRRSRPGVGIRSGFLVSGPGTTRQVTRSRLYASGGSGSRSMPRHL